MKSSENKQLELPPKIIENIGITLKKIKDLLGNNPTFYDTLIKKCLLIGGVQDTHHLNWDDITKLLYHTFPTLDEYEGGLELLSTTREFVDQLCFNTLDTRAYVYDLSDYNVLRTQLEEMMHSQLLGNIEEEI